MNSLLLLKQRPCHVCNGTIVRKTMQDGLEVHECDNCGLGLSAVRVPLIDIVEFNQQFEMVTA